MNKVHRVVWHAITGTWRAVAETAKSRTKRSGRSARAAVAAVLSASAMGAMAVEGTPGEVVPIEQECAEAEIGQEKSCKKDDKGVAASTGTAASSREDGTVAGAALDDVSTRANFADEPGDSGKYFSVNATDGMASAVGSNAIAIGRDAVAGQADNIGQNSMAIGHGAVTNNNNSMAIGLGAVAGLGVETWEPITVGEGENEVTLPGGTQRVGKSAMAIGDGATARTNDSIAIGTGAVAGLGMRPVEVEPGQWETQMVGKNAIAVGNGAMAEGTNAIALGTGAVAGRMGAIAIGKNAVIEHIEGAAYENNHGVVIGDDAYSSGRRGVVLGSASSVTGDWGVAIGSNVMSTGFQAIGMGDGANSGGEGAVALGSWSNASGTFATAVGRANAQADYSVAMGRSATVEEGASHSMALGTGARASTASSVALGNNSVADRANTVSVGNGRAQRQIVNVAAGTEDDDAVNLGQLKNTAGSVADALGGGATADANGRITKPTFTLNVGEGTQNFDNVGDAFDAVNGQLVNHGDTINNLTLGKAGIVKQDSENAEITVGSETQGTVVNFANSTGATRTLTGLSDGAVAQDSRDAINGSQLHGSLTSISEILGGGTTVNADGTIGAPSYVIGGEEYHTVEDALHAAAAHESADLKYFKVNSEAAGAMATGEDAVAIGPNASATGKDSVALGAGSLADRDNTVSVGQNGFERQIVNVAAGDQDSDAVTMGQLRAATQSVKDALGGEVGDEYRDTVHMPVYSIMDEQYEGVHATMDAIDEHLRRLDDGIDGGLVQQAAPDATITVGAYTGGTVVDFSNEDGTDRRLTGVADAVEDNDAVTLAQLKSAVGTDPEGNLKNAVMYDNAQLTSVTLAGAGGTLIHNVAAGQIAAGSMDAVNGGQLFDVQNDLQNQINNLGDRVWNIEQGGGGGGEDPGAPIEGIEWDWSEGVWIGDDATTSGYGTTAIGNEASASGESSTAIGGSAVASGDNSSALGNGSNASGQNSSAMGQGSNASGTNSTAMGQGSNATGEGSTAMGQGSSATGGSSTALGQGSNATGEGSTALGQGSKATGENSTAMGQGSSATGESSTALGQGSSASGSNSVALGAGSVADRENTVSVGSAGDERQITNVADGTQATDAVNVRQMNNAIGSLRSEVDGYRKDASAGTASAVAIANLPQAALAGESMVSVAGGTYGGQSAVAFGLSTATRNGKWVIKGSGSTNTRGTVAVGAGVGYRW